MSEQIHKAAARLWLALKAQENAEGLQMRYSLDEPDPESFWAAKRWWAASCAEVEAAQMEIVNAVLEEYTALEEAQP